MKLGVVGCSLSHVEGMTVPVLLLFDDPEVVPIGDTEEPGVEPVAVGDELEAVPFGEVVEPVVPVGNELLPDVVPVDAVDEPEVAPLGEVDDPDVVPVGVDEVPDPAPDDAPEDLGVVTFGGGGATGFPELKSVSKTTAIPADFELLSESLIE